MIGSEIFTRWGLSAVVFAALAAAGTPATASLAASPECVRNAQKLIVIYKLEARVQAMLSVRHKSAALNQLVGVEVYDILLAALGDQAAARPTTYPANYSKSDVRRIVGKALYAECNAFPRP